MKTQKILFAGITGGIIYLLLGWLLYGNLLAAFMKSNSGTATGVERLEPVFWALIIGNLLMGILLAYIFIRLSDISTVGSGIMAGGTIGLLISAGFDFVIYGTTNLESLKGVCVDVAIFTVISAIAGAGVAWIAGMGKKSISMAA